MNKIINIDTTNNIVREYSSGDGGWELVVNINNNTVWLTQDQIARLFGTQRPAITKHIWNILKSWELEEDSVSSILERTASDGKNYKSKFYNLDMIISVGYRVNSKQATQFRIWATNILREYVIKWEVIHQKYHVSPIKLLEITKSLLDTGKIQDTDALGVLEVLANYSNTWLLLQKYDENNLLKEGKTKKLSHKLDAKEAYSSLQELKKNLRDKKEATDLFAKLRDEKALEWIFWNIYQTFWGTDLYPSLEEKAAHLLYFIIKDHPFVDGNKRSGAFLFILFLAKNNLLFDTQGQRKINDRALVAITLLIAESKPKDKEMMTTLVLNLIH